MAEMCYSEMIEGLIRNGMSDTEIIKAVFAHYGIRSYVEKNGRFYHVDKAIMKHLRADIKELRGNVKWLQSLGL